LKKKHRRRRKQSQKKPKAENDGAMASVIIDGLFKLGETAYKHMMKNMKGFEEKPVETLPSEERENTPPFAKY